MRLMRKNTDGLMGELTQTVDQNTAVQLGFPALNSSDPTLPKCGVWPHCNRTGKLFIPPSCFLARK